MLKQHSRAAVNTAALFILAAALAGRADAAATFSAQPLKITLGANKLAGAITLGNKGTYPVTVQAELVSWSQDSGDDAYGPAEGLVMTPPIFRIDAGGSQVVRVGRLKRTAAPAREQAYRLVLSEVAPDTTVTEGGVSTVMRLSFPVFITPADRKARHQLQFAAIAQPGGGVTLQVANDGAVHGKLVGLQLVQGDAVLAERGLNFYVLAGARRQFAWPTAPAVSGPAVLLLKVDGQTEKIRIELPAPASSPAKADPAPAPATGD